MARTAVLIVLSLIPAVATSTAAQPTPLEPLFGVDRAPQPGHSEPEKAPAPASTDANLRVPAVRTVNVNCGAGQSINRALRRRAVELIVNIRGICDEDVVVRRDRVTLRGTDPATDGIRATGAGDPFSAALFIRESRLVTVENLQLTNGVRAGLRVSNSRRNIAVDNCRMDDNEGFGLVLVGSVVDMTASSMTGNRLAGAAVSEGSVLSCDDCTIFSNPVAGQGIGLLSSLASSAQITDSNISGRFAVIVGSGAFGTFTDSTVTGELDASGFGYALTLNSNGEINFRTGTIDGSILADGESQLNLLGAEQTSNPAPGGSFFTAGSQLQTSQLTGVSTTLVGNTVLDTFSKGIFRTTTDLGDLICLAGADAVCQGTVTKASSSCGLCP